MFRELYDQKKDIYDVLAQIIKDTIISNRIKMFTAPEMTNAVNERYSFNISEPIIKSSIKHLGIKRNNGVYTSPKEILDEENSLIYDIQNQQNLALLHKLFEYIWNETRTEIDEEEKEEIKKEFLEYLIDGQVDSKYSIYIRQFILNVSIDTQYISIINKIKEGQLIYEGICYNGNINELGKWTTKLDIYLEQEVIFYIAGYNGDVHKDMYRELLGYIEEINSGYQGEKKVHKFMV